MSFKSGFESIERVAV